MWGHWALSKWMTLKNEWLNKISNNDRTWSKVQFTLKGEERRIAHFFSRIHLWVDSSSCVKILGAQQQKKRRPSWDMPTGFLPELFSMGYAENLKWVWVLIHKHSPLSGMFSLQWNLSAWWVPPWSLQCPGNRGDDSLLQSAPLQCSWCSAGWCS